MVYTNTNGKAPGATNSKGLRNHTNGMDFRSQGAIDQALDGKSIAHQIARLALAGHVVHQAEGGDFLVTRWGQTRYCADFAELQAFAVKLGVNHE